MNKTFVAGKLYSGPRKTTVTDGNIPVTFFEVLYNSENKDNSLLKKAIISCVCYGSKSNDIFNKLSPYKSKSEGGDYEGMPPFLIIEGSIQSRKIKVSDEKKMRIMEVRVGGLTIIETTLSGGRCNVVSEIKS